MHRRTAYVVLISNEKYVDGALTLAWSLRQQSPSIQTKRCDLVLMLPPDSICDSNIVRLKQVGYRIVPVNYSLSETNKHSAWKGLDMYWGPVEGMIYQRVDGLDLHRDEAQSESRAVSRTPHCYPPPPGPNTGLFRHSDAVFLHFWV